MGRAASLELWHNAQGRPAGKGPRRINPTPHSPSLCADHAQSFLLAGPTENPVTSGEQLIQDSFLRHRVEKGGKWFWQEDSTLS